MIFFGLFMSLSIYAKSRDRLLLFLILLFTLVRRPISVIQRIIRFLGRLVLLGKTLGTRSFKLLERRLQLRLRGLGGGVQTTFFKR